MGSTYMYQAQNTCALKKKWSQNGFNVELFEKTARLFNSAFFQSWENVNNIKAELHFFLNNHVLVLKWYLIGGHPVVMKMAPLWSHFDSTFFFQYGF